MACVKGREEKKKSQTQGGRQEANASFEKRHGPTKTTRNVHRNAPSLTVIFPAGCLSLWLSVSCSDASVIDRGEADLHAIFLSFRLWVGGVTVGGSRFFLPYSVHRQTDRVMGRRHAGRAG
mmetsp:Transcript_16896/g.34312  ORF Transcript_16896/g.34312 Transcript_16896/m.34312 type:complete len:121 (+) Transcript_16896:396-758(+)